MQHEHVLATIIQQEPFLRDHLILLVVAGSRGYGLATETSDLDMRGIAFAPLSAVYGLDVYEQTILAEPDTVIYSLRKYLKLAIKGNPNILELLFAEGDSVLYCNQWGEELRARRSYFLSKRIGQSFGGYAIGNLRKLSARQQADSTYDGKDASHLIRLLQSGVELLRTGHLQVKRDNAAELLAIRNGEWPLAQVLKRAEALYQDLLEACDHSLLPDEPDRAAIQALLIKMQQRFYGGRDG